MPQSYSVEIRLPEPRRKPFCPVFRMRTYQEAYDIAVELAFREGMIRIVPRDEAASHSFSDGRVVGILPPKRPVSS